MLLKTLRNNFDELIYQYRHTVVSTTYYTYLKYILVLYIHTMYYVLTMSFVLEI